MAGMFLVNFIGAYAVIPATFKHHRVYCSYADTVMPHFFFAVGFAYRLTFLKRAEALGKPGAYRRAILRCLGLILVGAVVYHLDFEATSWQKLREVGIWGFLSAAFRSSVFQALVHIGVTSLWILPVIGARPGVRALYLIGSGLLHLVLSHIFYYDWALENRVIDGGPLGFLSWTIPTLTGSLACDGLLRRGPGRAVAPFLGWALLLMVVGYGFSCLNLVDNVTEGGGLARYLIEPPFVPPSRPVDIWNMSQQTGSISYLTFSAGFSLGLYALFVLGCDVIGIAVGFLRTFGRNPLAGYLIHMIVADAIQPLVPREAPLWYVSMSFAVYIAITYIFLWSLERRRLFLRL